ncbi:uncharacterized protein [Anoplolepis gracilipes]|uniref:uncharacterized protein n=1 Tax=Anoplolepis gracilipes TaxID=354296 RepID=UPI003BA0137A
MLTNNPTTSKQAKTATNSVVRVRKVKNLLEGSKDIKGFFATVEEAYHQNKGVLLDFAAHFSKPSPAPTSSRFEASAAHRTTLPQFSGKYDEWPSFRDLFQSIIGKDDSTAPVEKLHYLKSCLKGEAEVLIRNLPTTEENFARAWQLLTGHYENKRLVRTYIVQVTSLQKLKGESTSELRNLTNRVRTTVNSLDSIGRPITRSEDLFVHTIVELLDPRTRRDWETSISESTDPPTYKELQQFLDRRLNTLGALLPVKGEASSSKSSATRQTRSLHARKTESKLGRCSMCRKDHFIMLCDMYKSKTAEERKHPVETNNLCLNCLGRHKVSECASQRTCSTCQDRHHMSLHDTFRISSGATTSHLARSPPTLSMTVLLATARVPVADRFGKLHPVRALINQGSESSLISESLAQRLRLPRTPTTIAVFGGIQTGLARGQVHLTLALRGEGPSLHASALIFPKLTIYESRIKADPSAWTHLKGLGLADSAYLDADPVDVLLGADVYAVIIQAGLKKGDSREPVAQKTFLGWILSGTAPPTPFRRLPITAKSKKA